MALKHSYIKQRGIGLLRGIRYQRVQSLTAGGNAAATIGTKLIEPYGFTQIAITSTGTGGTHKYGLKPPGAGAVGTEKKIVLALAVASTVDVAIVNQTNATKFYNSTCNAVLFSTAPKQSLYIELIAVSSAQWAITSSPGSTAAGSKKNIFALTNLTS